jgi:hypothetical protein
MVGPFKLFRGGGFSINSKLAYKQPVMMSIVSVALCCYAFIVAERTRHFPSPLGPRSG